MSFDAPARANFLGLLRDGSTPYVLIRNDGRMRWAFPVASGAEFRAASDLYRPGTMRAAAMWRGARLLARLGMAKAVWGRHGRYSVTVPIEDMLGRGVDCFGVASSFDGERCVLAAISEGRAVAFIKVASRAADSQRLAHEEAILRRLEDGWGALRVPRVLWSGEVDGLSYLVLSTVDGRPFLRPWHITGAHADLAARVFATPRATTILGVDAFAGDETWEHRLDRARARVAGRSVPASLVHGDFAPWNITGAGRGLVDWEQARFDGPAFWDLWHFAVQTAALTGRASARRALKAATGKRGPLWAAIERYASAVGTPSALALDVLVAYAAQSALPLIADARPDHGRGAAVRAEILDRLLETR